MVKWINKIYGEFDLSGLDALSWWLTDTTGWSLLKSSFSPRTHSDRWRNHCVTKGNTNQPKAPTFITHRQHETSNKISLTSFVQAKVVVDKVQLFPTLINFSWKHIVSLSTTVNYWLAQAQAHRRSGCVSFCFLPQQPQSVRRYRRLF